MPGRNAIPIEKPKEGCFLCDPEPWRVVFSGRTVRVIAALGPLCEGYVIVSPKDHTHTSAQLVGECLWEFLCTASLVQTALRLQYRPGYTAYEHGKTGACRVLEEQDDFSTFCHHCHRVFVPRPSDCLERLRANFGNMHVLSKPEEITALADVPYVYYETSFGDSAVTRVAFTDGGSLPSQFMRRILVDELKLERHYDWSIDPNYAGISATVAALRSEFVGLDDLSDYSCPEPNLVLRQNISLDGFSRVGKTTIAKLIGSLSHRPVVDSGLIFRALALADFRGERAPSTTELKELLLSGAEFPEGRTPDVSAKAGALAADAHFRRLYETHVQELVLRLSP
jgi:hypothetical protein